MIFNTKKNKCKLLITQMHLPFFIVSNKNFFLFNFLLQFIPNPTKLTKRLILN